MKALGCVLFVFILLLPANNTVYMRGGNVFSNSFTEHIEVLYVVFYDGYFLRFTTNHEDGIAMPYSVFKEAITSKGRKISDIAIAIHNHLPGDSWHLSRKDEIFFMYMRGDGFTGSFCLYTPGGTVRIKNG